MANLRQAEAAYRAALTQVPQARSNYLYQKQATDAAIAKAQSALQTQEARTRAANQQLTLAARTTQSQVAQASSQVHAAQAQADQAAAQVKTAQAAVVGNRQGVQTAERAVRILEARVQSAQADLDRASKDEARYRGLLVKEAVTQQQYDAVEAQLASAQSALRALQGQIAQAHSQVDQAQATVAQSEAQLAATQEAARAAQQQVGVAQAGLTLARANQIQVPVQEANLAATATQNSQAQADIAAAEAGRTQEAARREQIATTLANLKQAEAALQNARITEQDTYIYAPTDGTVVRKSVNVGASLSTGQTVLTITQGDGVYVTANFKETQIGDVRVGQPVEIDVDALPGKVFKGVVGAINEATGATTSLLPPDNATGNFTKVVQRIPVKIALVPGDSSKREATPEDITLLRQGMSVTATIDITDTKPHPERVPQGYDKGFLPDGVPGNSSNVTSVPGSATSGGTGDQTGNAPAANGPTGQNASITPSGMGTMNGQSGAGAPLAVPGNAAGSGTAQPSVQTGPPSANETTQPAVPPGADNANPAANGGPAAHGVVGSNPNAVNPGAINPAGSGTENTGATGSGGGR
jgi:membrane fusion protein (multidrug efflux system)